MSPIDHLPATSSVSIIHDWRTDLDSNAFRIATLKILWKFYATLTWLYLNNYNEIIAHYFLPTKQMLPIRRNLSREKCLMLILWSNYFGYWLWKHCLFLLSSGLLAIFCYLCCCLLKLWDSLQTVQFWSSNLKWRFQSKLSIGTFYNRWKLLFAMSKKYFKYWYSFCFQHKFRKLRTLNKLSMVAKIQD